MLGQMPGQADSSSEEYSSYRRSCLKKFPDEGGRVSNHFPRSLSSDLIYPATPIVILAARAIRRTIGGTDTL